jgi:hypothetical protein
MIKVASGGANKRGVTKKKTEPGRANVHAAAIDKMMKSGVRG